MLNATELKNGICFLYKDEPYKVLQYKHTHLGRGGADIRIKALNIKKGKIFSFNFGSNDRFEEVILEKKKFQYLYSDGEKLYFMNPQNFEQISLDKEIIGDKYRYLKEGEEAQVLYWEDKALDLDLPVSMVFNIVECDPGVKGNSVSNIYKQAVLDNGLKIKVPLFIKKGDKVRVDTRTGQYLERVS